MRMKENKWIDYHNTRSGGHEGRKEGVMREYYLESGTRVVEADIHITLYDEYVEEIEKVLTVWQKYKNKDGKYPFKDWTYEDALKAVIDLGLHHHINNNIKYIQDSIT